MNHWVLEVWWRPGRVMCSRSYENLEKLSTKFAPDCCASSNIGKFETIPGPKSELPEKHEGQNMSETVLMSNGAIAGHKLSVPKLHGP